MDGTSCGRCPAFQPFLEFDWKTPHYLMAFYPDKKPMLDNTGKHIMRLGPDGEPINIGCCTLRSGPPTAEGEAFPRRLGTMGCHDPDKYALLDRLKAERAAREAMERVTSERQQ